MSTHIIIVIMGALLLFVVTQIRMKYRRLSKGETTTGTVTAIEQVANKNRLVPTPVIQFTTYSQVTVEKRSDESILPARIKKGTKVKVLYNPANPGDFLAQGLQFNKTTIVVLVASIIFTAFGCILLLNDLKIIHILG